MEQVLLSRQDLAKRWGFSSTKVIENYELSGIIKRVPYLPTPRYSIHEIMKIENLGEEISPLSPIERRRLERRIENLEKEVSLYREKLSNIKMIVE